MNWGGLLISILGLVLVLVAVRGSYANVGRVLVGQAPVGTSASGARVGGNGKGTVSA